ncbi:S8 family peptidase [Microseira wollei]|uniref:Protease n=1 Tax=Microseira wollei NIES-4236 TaxID=2530354 RepID=A0AAV3X9D1_9CYAN|nr:S8 family serine peptidase [Microseira wollei]GET37978.1 protease [Microseira wollei NIES-4236]
MVNNLNSMVAGSETTGRYLILFREDAVDAGIQMLSESASINLSGEADSPIVLSTLGVAVVSAAPAQLRSLRVSADENSPILAIEPERVVYALEDPELGNPKLLRSPTTMDVTADYLKGYRDAVNQLVGSLLPTEQGQLTLKEVDESVATWGLQATKVVNSCYSGQGIKIAVLDTGFDLNHPDFIGRSIQSKSFIPGEEVQDGHGHGTHCIGTALGALKPSQLPRYGIAYNAEIYAGKVLSNRGSGADGGILQGIEWAIANGCQVISMSLGSPTEVGTPYSRVYEAVAQRALSRGTLIVAAAGNESRRDLGTINPVGRPANCPSIMAVAAIDSQMQIARFSTRGINPDGGQIDIAGPGVAVRSSWLMPTQYNKISGTSMATPHVAGIAALHAQATGLKGQELWNLLVRTARRLPLPSEDVGVGIVQAP